MTMLKVENTEIGIIPAQPGWCVATTRPNDRKLDKTPVIAWTLRWDKYSNSIDVRPISLNTDGNSLCNLVPGYVVGDTEGNFWSLLDRDAEKMQSEDEAVQFCNYEKVNDGTVYTPDTCAQGGQQ